MVGQRALEVEFAGQCPLGGWKTGSLDGGGCMTAILLEALVAWQGFSWRCRLPVKDFLRGVGCLARIFWRCRLLGKDFLGGVGCLARIFLEV